jgi:hypothetical protein
MRQDELSQQEKVDTSQEDVLGLVADDASTDLMAATHPNEALHHQSARQDRLSEAGGRGSSKHFKIYRENECLYR